MGDWHVVGSNHAKNKTKFFLAKFFLFAWYLVGIETLTVEGGSLMVENILLMGS